MMIVQKVKVKKESGQVDYLNVGLLSSEEEKKKKVVKKKEEEMKKKKKLKKKKMMMMMKEQIEMVVDVGEHEENYG